MKAANLHRLPGGAIYLLAVLGGLLATGLAIYADPLINTDGILYLRTASAYIDGGYDAAVALYSRPFYSVLIAWVHVVVDIPLLHAAYVINAICHAVAACGFIFLLWEVGGSNRILWIGVILVLLLPQLNDYRHYVVRDAGFWALGLVSLAAFQRFYRTWQLRALVAWLCLAVLASLFRPEAVLLLSLPLCLVPEGFRGQEYRARLAKATLVVLASLALLMAVAWAMFGMDVTLQVIGEPVRTIGGHFGEITSRFGRLSDDFAQNTLSQYSVEHAQPALLVALLYVNLAHLVDAAGWLLILGLLALWFTARKKPYPCHRVLPVIWITTIYLIAPYLVLIDRQTIQDRHFVFPVILLALWMPFLLDRLVAPGWLRSGASRIVGPALLGLYLFVDSFFSFGTSKDYILDASEWLRHSTPDDSVLYTNSSQIAWYAQRPVDWEKILEFRSRDQHAQKLEFDYLAVVIKRDNGAMLKRLQEDYPELMVVQSFSNTRNDQAVILRNDRVVGADG